MSDATAESAQKGGWFSRLKAGLSRSSSRLGDGISGIFTKRKLDDGALEELEELLITSDLGVATAAKLTAKLAAGRFDKEIAPEEVRRILADAIAEILAPVAQPLALDPAQQPSVVLVVGVNGSGKTTTIGKLAAQQRAEGRRVRLAAGDTFRAAAIDQLKIWSARADCPIVAKAPGSDASGLAYEALEVSRREGDDLLLIDTAGRLHNKADLMAELKKISRVLKKLDEKAPHHCILVLDATTGQNAHAQVETFKQLIDVTGLVITKLDGSARGGVLVGLAERFGLPVHAIGVGEGLSDLRPFDPADFARALVGLEQ